MFRALAMIGLGVGCSYALVYYLSIGTAIGALGLTASGLLCLLAPLLYRRTGSRTAATTLLLVVIVAVLVFVSLMRGGFPASTLAFLVFIPLLAYYTLGIRAAVVWAAVSILVEVGIFTLAAQGRELAALRVEASEQTWLAVDLFGTIVLVLSILLVAAAYERRRARAAAEARRAEQMLERSQRLESVGSLAAGVAHDFNNLLSVITGTASLLKLQLDLEPEDPAAEELDHILRVCSSAAELTGQLLLFSNKKTSPGRPVDANEIIEGLHPLLSRSLREDIELALDLRAEAWVRVDPVRLEQSVMNLALNAQDAMPRGGILTIETAEVAAGSGEPRVRIRVADTGEGMSPETLQRAFEPFFTTKPRSRGTGLGLAMVYATIESAGGEIGIESAPGRGTTVELELPAEPAQRERGAPSASEPARPDAAPPFAPDASILVVEDDPAVRETLAANLEHWGLEVFVAADGAEALEVVFPEGDGATPPAVDLVLTDVVMPRMSGAELGARLAELAPDLPVIYMSGYTDLDGERIPPDRLISKPFDLEELRRRLGRSVAPPAGRPAR